MWWQAKSEMCPEMQFEALSRMCRLVISSEGSLDVVLLGPSLNFKDLAYLLGRLEVIGGTGGLRQVVIDFEAIEEILNPWTAVLALLIQFATRANFACQVRNLKDQPANIFSLYRRNRDLMRLVSVGEPAESAPTIRRAG